MSARLRGMAREILKLADPSRPDVASAIDGTRSYLPSFSPDLSSRAVAVPKITVTGSSTLGATRWLGGDVTALVFASARNPGGGFLNGAQAQEESVARGSALYRCLLAAPDFYDAHRASRSLLYSDRVIYSPRVPVFRDGRDRLLDEPYPVNFLTCAAPNLSAITRNAPADAPAVPETLHRRATQILRVAAAHDHRRLVLGAWGCGVFGNDPSTVAAAFAAALRTVPHFDEVVFAVLDRNNGPTRQAFDTAFDTGNPPGR